MPLGLDGSGLPRFDRESICSELSLKKDSVVGLYFGRFSDADKMDLLPLLNAFSDVAKRDKNANLWLGGSVQEKEYFEIVKLWIKRLGLDDQVRVFVNPDDELKWKLYSAAHFFISLSDNPQETFGITLLEAMAFGRPLLVSDYNGYRNLVDEEFSLSVPTLWNKFPIIDQLSPFLDERTYHRYLGQCLSLDNRVLLEHLSQLYEDSEMRDIMGVNARREFTQKFDYRVIVPALEHLWRRRKEGFIKKTRKIRDPAAMHFSSVFEHYPTGFLSNTHTIKRSDFGTMWLEQKSRYPMLFAMESIFSWEQAEQALIDIAEPCTVGDFLARYAEESWKYQYMISWLIKQGLVEIAGAVDDEI